MCVCVCVHSCTHTHTYGNAHNSFHSIWRVRWRKKINAILVNVSMCSQHYVWGHDAQQNTWQQLKRELNAKKKRRGREEKKTWQATTMTINRVFKNRHSTPSINKSMNKTATIPFIFIHFFVVACLLASFFFCPIFFSLVHSVSSFLRSLSFPSPSSPSPSLITVHWYSITYQADTFSLVSTK